MATTEAKLYSVSDIALSIGVTKSQVFYAINKIKESEELEIIFENKKHLYSEESYIRIKSYFDNMAKDKALKDAITSDSKSINYNLLLESKEEQIKALQSEIETLKNTIEFYKKQIEAQTIQNHTMLTMIQDSQLKLEAPKKSFISRLFGK